MSDQTNPGERVEFKGVETDGTSYGHQPSMRGWQAIEKGYRPPEGNPIPPNAPMPVAADPVWRPPANQNLPSPPQGTKADRKG